jgi:hypothetical protein
MRLVFSDEFDGTQINTSRWNVLNKSKAYCPANA